jgi:predicted phosphate transport protein (TIGR00153 family)
MAFWKKQSQIEQMIEEYLAESDKCLQAFGEAFEEYFSSGNSEAFAGKVERVRQLEWAADQERREVEAEMFSKALIPELRGDILSLLEALDEVPNECEEVTREVRLQGLLVPEEYRRQVQELIRVSIEANERLHDAVARLFASPAEVAPAADKVIEKEKAADAIEQELIRAIFESSRDLAEKILLKQVVSGIADISDRAEDASDLIRIIAVKQQA